MQLIDLTIPLDENTPIYSEGDYSDPPLRIDPWCEIAAQGYRVAHLQLGTQTGTHIDAPAHFSEGGDTLEALPIDVLIGPYLWVDLADQAQMTQLCQHPTCTELILFLTSSDATAVQNGVTLSLASLTALLTLPCRVWVIVYGIQIAGKDPLYFHRALAEAGKYLIEDVDTQAAQQVRSGGELIALPMRLVGVSGSPCRVVVRSLLTP